MLPVLIRPPCLAIVGDRDEFLVILRRSFDVLFVVRFGGILFRAVPALVTRLRMGLLGGVLQEVGGLFDVVASLSQDKTNGCVGKSARNAYAHKAQELTTLQKISPWDAALPPPPLLPHKQPSSPRLSLGRPNGRWHQPVYRIPCDRNHPLLRLDDQPWRHCPGRVPNGRPTRQRRLPWPNYRSELGRCHPGYRP